MAKDRDDDTNGVKPRPTRLKATSKIEWVNMDSVEIREEAQRDFRPHWAQQIAADFDPDGFGIPAVVELQGKSGPYFICVDGQHRIHAAKKVLGSNQLIQCEVFRNCTLAEAAEKYLKRNHILLPRPYDKFDKAVRAKRPAEVAIVKVLEKRHCKVTKGGEVEGGITAVMSLKRVYEMVEGEDLLGLALDVLIEAWGRDSVNFSGDILVGLARLLSRYRQQMDMAHLVRALTTCTGGALGLIGRARAYRTALGVSMPNATARAIGMLYNKRMRKNPLPEWGEEDARH
jgi:hypothetical protein